MALCFPHSHSLPHAHSSPSLDYTKVREKMRYRTAVAQCRIRVACVIKAGSCRICTIPLGFGEGLIPVCGSSVALCGAQLHSFRVCRCGSHGFLPCILLGWFKWQVSLDSGMFWGCFGAARPCLWWCCYLIHVGTYLFFVLTWHGRRMRKLVFGRILSCNVEVHHRNLGMSNTKWGFGFTTPSHVLLNLSRRVSNSPFNTCIILLPLAYHNKSMYPLSSKPHPWCSRISPVRWINSWILLTLVLVLVHPPLPISYPYFNPWLPTLPLSSQSSHPLPKKTPHPHI